jgi:hypothetical protein
MAKAAMTRREEARKVNAVEVFCILCLRLCLAVFGCNGKNGRRSASSQQAL